MTTTPARTLPRALADEVVCVASPEHFRDVGELTRLPPALRCGRAPPAGLGRAARRGRARSMTPQGKSSSWCSTATRLAAS
jgi:hypothetical protein